jgi:uncharacterized protein (UPF0335 family)
MRQLLPVTVAAALLLGTPASAQQPTGDRAERLEAAREAIAARLTRSTLKDVAVSASDVKAVRRITIALRPFNKDPRDDASTALMAAWQPAVQHVTAFDEIAVQVGSDYAVMCGRRAFADTRISLWGEGLTRTCREQRQRRRPQ